MLEEAEVSDKAAPSRRSEDREGQASPTPSWLKSSSASPWCIQDGCPHQWRAGRTQTHSLSHLYYLEEKPSSIAKISVFVIKIELNQSLLLEAALAIHAGCRSRWLCLLPAHRPNIVSSGMWAVSFIKLLKTRVHWVNVGWRIVETFPGTPGLCTWNSSRGWARTSNRAFDQFLILKNKIFVTGPKYLNMMTFCQWNYNVPLWDSKLIGWKTLCENCFLLIFYPFFQFFSQGSLKSTY